LAAARKAELAAVDVDGVPDKLHGMAPPCRCALKKTKGGRRGAQIFSKSRALHFLCRWAAGGQMHAGVAALRPCAQRGNSPRALAISILELSQVTFQDRARAMTDESSRCQLLPFHDGDTWRFANG